VCVCVVVVAVNLFFTERMTSVYNIENDERTAKQQQAGTFKPTSCTISQTEM